jgi:2-dehydro-3-deoxyphosphogluconate aldolase / (4S)-4-hydroxy-2-oxoglutarate aldolase
MKKTQVLEKIEQVGIVPVIRAASAREAERQIAAVLAGGISIFEITMTVPNAPRLIEKLSARYGEKILLGAGTVLNRNQAADCVKSGAKFIVSPVLKREVVEFCSQNETAVFPAGLTPNEIFAAAETGADAVKIFPANAMGGASYLKSLKTVFPEIKMMPTGGINLETVKDFFQAGAFAVGVGGELTKGEADEITGRTEKFLRSCLKTQK